MLRWSSDENPPHSSVHLVGGPDYGRRLVEIHSVPSENWGFETETYLSRILTLRSQTRSDADAEVYFFLQGDPFDHCVGPECRHNFFNSSATLGPRDILATSRFLWKRQAR